MPVSANSEMSTYQPFRWRAGVRTDLPVGGIFNAVALDAEYYVGSAAVPMIPNGNAIRYSPITGFQNLGKPVGIRGSNDGTGLSADGNVVVGYFNDSSRYESTSYRWSSTTGIVNIGHINNAQIGYTRAYGVSADGDTIVGESTPNRLFVESVAIVWTASGGVQPLPLPQGASPGTPGVAKAISGDGRVIVGYVQGGIPNATVWVDRAATRMISPSSGIFVTGTDVNFDGSVIVGRMTSPTTPNSPTIGFIYTLQTGVMPGAQFLREQGVSIPLTARVDVTCVSGDGLTFGGNYWDPMNGVSAQAFVATIPTPGVAVTVVMCGLVWARRRIR